MNYGDNANIDRSYNKDGKVGTNELNPYASTQGPMFPCHLYLMDNFNHRIVTIDFSNAWLCKLSTVPLDYTNTSDT